MTAPIVFVWDSDYFFAYSQEAQEDIMNKGTYLMPPNCTEVAPAFEEGNHYRWNEENKEWEAVPIPKSAAEFVGVQVSHKSQTLRDQELRSLLQKYVSEDPDHYRVVRGTEEEGLYWSVEEIPQPTETELKIQAAKTEIAQLKAKLNETDYVVAKIAEGVSTKEDYAEVLEDRQEWRGRINELEAEIQTLEA